ncbi:MAG: O-antigen ligase domain-containing protein [Pedosphaera sp.]|nr:O-antigen ligase domain-containing protein [Pedosphaera sp.]
MRALLQLAPLLIILFCVSARGNIRNFIVQGAIVTLPFRITYGVATSNHAGWVDGVVISLSDILFVLFACHTGLKGTLRPVFLSKDGVARGLIFLAAAGMISVINTTSKPFTLCQVILVMQVLFINYLCMVRCINNRDDLYSALQGVSFSLMLQGVIGCTQFALQGNFLWFSTGSNSGQNIGIGDEDSSLIRVFGTVGKPNGFAMLLSPMLLMNIALLSRNELPGRRLRVLSVFLGSLGLVFSGSRGGWLSCAAALLFYFGFTFWQQKERRGQLLRGAMVFLALVCIAGGPFIKQRLTSDDRNAASSRLPLIRIAVGIIKAHPIVGIGANTYQNVMRRFIPSDFEAWVGQVHNTYLLVMAEMGLIGSIAFFLLMRNLFTEAVSCVRMVDHVLQPTLGLGLLLVLVQVSFHMLVEAYVGKMALGMLFMLVGIVGAARKLDV